MLSEVNKRILPPRARKPILAVAEDSSSDESSDDESLNDDADDAEAADVEAMVTYAVSKQVDMSLNAFCSEIGPDCGKVFSGLRLKFSARVLKSIVWSALLDPAISWMEKQKAGLIGMTAEAHYNSKVTLHVPFLMNDKGVPILFGQGNAECELSSIRVWRLSAFEDGFGSLMKQYLQNGRRRCEILDIAELAYYKRENIHNHHINNLEDVYATNECKLGVFADLMMQFEIPGFFAPPAMQAMIPEPFRAWWNDPENVVTPAILELACGRTPSWDDLMVAHDAFDINAAKVAAQTDREMMGVFADGKKVTRVKSGEDKDVYFAMHGPKLIQQLEDEAAALGAAIATSVGAKKNAATVLFSQKEAEVQSWRDYVDVCVSTVLEKPAKDAALAAQMDKDRADWAKVMEEGRRLKIVADAEAKKKEDAKVERQARAYRRFDLSAVTECYLMELAPSDRPAIQLQEKTWMASKMTDPSCQRMAKIIKDSGEACEDASGGYEMDKMSSTLLWTLFDMVYAMPGNDTEDLKTRLNEAY